MRAEVMSDPVHPLTLIRDAVLAARAEGYPVVIGPGWGVICTSSHGARRWEVDPLAPGVDPLGAVLLRHQPRATNHQAALAEALDVPLVYVDGLEDGIEDRQRPTRRFASSVARGFYAAGWGTAALIREQLLREGARS
jgi:hypothetical protein